MNLAVCFCLHAGELEIKAILLAASLKKYWPADVELIGCVPENSQFGGLTNDSAQILDSLGVRLTSVSNPIGPDYPIGNKLLCLDIETGADRILFLDSDIIALRPVSRDRLNSELGEGFAAKPADIATCKVDHETWHAIYRSCGVPMPDAVFRATTSGETMKPYFNAGVISTQANSGLGRHWAQCSAIIDALPEVPTKRPHLDQIALPVAVSRLGLRTNLLTEEWNYPAHLRPLPADLPRLCHYHWPQVIEREPALLGVVRGLAEEAPGITDAMRRQPLWQRLADKLSIRQQKSQRRRLPEGVITGIPRSGTSYLCRLLHALPDHVVMNEPSEIFIPLQQTAPGHRLACYYRDLRRRILDGEPVENKTDGSGIVADTAKKDVRTKAPIAAAREDFMLWSKNTLAYLNRLPQLLDAMPDATFVACVRHPVDTIASWTRTFPHLRDANVERFPVGYPSDPLLSPSLREQLAVIAACTDTPRRRALLWNYLANIILQHQERLIIVRLEDLAADPLSMVDFLASGARRSADSLRDQPVTRNAPHAHLAECMDCSEAFGYRFHNAV
jgi:hypothetical protein